MSVSRDVELDTTGSLDELTDKILELDERERSVGKSLLHATRALEPLIRDLPTAEIYLLLPTAVEAWRILRDEDPQAFMVYLGEVRYRCGSVVASVVQRRVGMRPVTQAREIHLLTPAEVRDRAPMPYLVRDVFPSKGLAACIGPPGCGKSFLMFSLACEVARGSDEWFGKPIGSGAVIYVAAEGSLGPRLKAYEQYHNVRLGKPCKT